MKTFSNYFVPGLCIVALLLGMCKNSASNKEVKTGKAGDQLDLFAVMNTFEKSSSPEAFEKSLNSKSVGVNNLDLNEDGQTDYIRVTDKKIDNTSHVLILQVDVEAGKTQDVATIEIQKIKENQAHLQIIGDKDLYGNDYIVEPKSNDAVAGFVIATTFAVNVWSWPAVAYIYSPSYVVWVSPYYYEYYPVWWEPWPVVVYGVYYPVVSVYHTHYSFSDGYRFVNVHENYHNNYRVATNFKYSEKDHGVSHTKINMKENQKGGGAGGKDKDYAPRENKNVNSTGHDKPASPAKNDHRSGGGKDYNKSSGDDDKHGGTPKSNAKKSAPDNKSGMNKSPATKQQPKPQGGAKQNPQPKGDKHGGGSHGGGGKHK